LGDFTSFAQLGNIAKVETNAVHFSNIVGNACCVEEEDGVGCDCFSLNVLHALAILSHIFASEQTCLLLHLVTCMFDNEGYLVHHEGCILAVLCSSAVAKDFL